MLYTLSKPLHLSEPVFSFANEVLGRLVPESLPAMTFQTAHPWLANTASVLPGAGQTPGASMAGAHTWGPKVHADGAQEQDVF